jgi:hypothetical protein
MNNLKLEILGKVFAKKIRFEQWLGKMFFLNDELHKEYNGLYQDIFYIVLNDMFIDGSTYLDHIIDSIIKDLTPYKAQWYIRLKSGFEQMQSCFDVYEIEFIKYKRHNACHMFLDNYDIIQNSGKIKDQITIYNESGEKQKVKLEDLNKKFDSILLKYGFDEGFDHHLDELLYPVISKLYTDLTEITQNAEDSGEKNTD